MRGVTICGLIWFVAFLSPTGAQAVSINVMGPEQTVYDYDTMHCYPFDQPDIPARAFRDDLGRTQIDARRREHAHDRAEPRQL